jgi:hypothetical protein
MLAVYDLCAVLTPCGPLKALVNLMQHEDAPEMVRTKRVFSEIMIHQTTFFLFCNSPLRITAWIAL